MLQAEEGVHAHVGLAGGGLDRHEEEGGRGVVWVVDKLRHIPDLLLPRGDDGVQRGREALVLDQVSQRVKLGRALGGKLCDAAVRLGTHGDELPEGLALLLLPAVAVVSTVEVHAQVAVGGSGKSKWNEGERIEETLNARMTYTYKRGVGVCLRVCFVCKRATRATPQQKIKPRRKKKYSHLSLSSSFDLPQAT